MVLVALAALLPIMIFGVPHGADLPNHLRFALPFSDAIQSGDFHPGWLAESNDGLGDPRFRFYPPGFYYLVSAVRVLTGGWYMSTIVVLALLSIAGGLGAYFWARTVCEPKIALWAGVLYAIAPYRLNEVYQASLLSEYAACSILPFTFFFVERICRKRNFSDVAGLALAYALLVLTHLPMAVIGSISLGIYVLFRIERGNLLSTLARLAVGVLLGLAASSFFWTTMLAELSWIKGSGADPNIYYNYRVNFLFSPSALTNRNTWYANILALAVLGFLLPGLVLAGRWFRKDSLDRGLMAALPLTLITFLMTTGLSRPVWAVIPKLSEVQFPWRWLSVTSLMGALLVAASIPQWIQMLRANVRPRDLAVALALVLSLAFTGTQIIYDSEYVGSARFESMAREVRGAVSFKDWLPAGASELTKVEKMAAVVEAGSRPVTITSWEPERRTFHIAAGNETTARVRTYFYPHWIAKADGRVLPTAATTDGLIEIAAPAQATEIELAFVEPPRTWWFELVTRVSWLLIVGSLALGWIRRRGLLGARALSPAMPRRR